MLKHLKTVTPSDGGAFSLAYFKLQPGLLLALVWPNTSYNLDLWSLQPGLLQAKA